MSENKIYSEKEILLTYEGRCISDKEDLRGDYCGSCSIEIHRSQLADPKSWVHSSINNWLAKIKPLPSVEQLQAELEAVKAERDRLKELQTTVQICCNPPEDCNDPIVLKNYMKECYVLAEKEQKL